MRKILNNLSKVFSLLLVVAISFITLTACSNNKNKQATVTPAVELTDNTNSSEKENVAENVTNSDETNTPDETIDSIQNEENSSGENTTPEYPVVPGIYKFEKLDLTFNDIYYEDETALLNYFKTRDLNGVYDIVYELGFESFVKSITYYINNETSYEIVVSLNKNESDNSELAITPLYINAPNSYADFSESIIYSVENGKIIEEANKPKFLIDERTNNISILFPFEYTDSETYETVYTPLYIKVNLAIIDEFDIMMDESIKLTYEYLDNSSKIESVNGFMNEDEALTNLAKMLNVSEDKVIETISNFELSFTDDEKLYICVGESSLILTKKTENSTSYLVYDSFYLDVVNESYDFETGIKTLNIKIQIDENTMFTCKFVSDLI